MTFWTTVLAVMVGVSLLSILKAFVGLLILAASRVSDRRRIVRSGGSAKQVEHAWRQAMTGEPR